jgi:hypothetical protein
MSGIATATACHKEIEAFNICIYNDLSDVAQNLRFVPAFNKDPYRAVNTQA